MSTLLAAVITLTPTEAVSVSATVGRAAHAWLLRRIGTRATRRWPQPTRAQASATLDGLEPMGGRAGARRAGQPGPAAAVLAARDGAE